MEGLQRSSVSFRRQGSSGLVWDDKFLSGELNKLSHNDQNQQPARASTSSLPDVKPINTTIQRSRSSGGSSAGYRTAGKVTLAVEPPSPRVSACGCCAAFRKPAKEKHHRRKGGKQPRSR